MFFTLRFGVKLILVAFSLHDHQRTDTYSTASRCNLTLLNSHFLCIGTLLVGNSTSKLSEMLMNSDCTEFWPMFNLHNRGGINSNMLVISEFHL